MGIPHQPTVKLKSVTPTTYCVIGNYVKAAVFTTKKAPASNRDKAETPDEFMERKLTYNQLQTIGEYDYELPHNQAMTLNNTVVPTLDAKVTHVECYFLTEDGCIVELFTNNINHITPGSNQFSTDYLRESNKATKAIFITGLRGHDGSFYNTQLYMCRLLSPENIVMARGAL
jgi:hypothetical protein